MPTGAEGGPGSRSWDGQEEGRVCGYYVESVNIIIILGALDKEFSMHLFTLTCWSSVADGCGGKATPMPLPTPPRVGDDPLGAGVGVAEAPLHTVTASAPWGGGPGPAAARAEG